MSVLEKIAKWVAGSDHIVGFSGAGISTESGIPDFRSPNGIWANNRMVYYQEFLSSEEDRIEYWRQKSAIWPEMEKAEPNEGHLFFVKLFEQNKLLGMITQNIEKLHQRSGLPENAVVELHGNLADVVCLDCGDRTAMTDACRRVREGDRAPRCLKCRGILKPATVSFGQNLVVKDLLKSEALSVECDLFISVGSSLVVHPAAGFPQLAKEHGAKLVIINRTPTPLDSIADAVIHDEIGPTLKKISEICFNGEKK